MDRTDVRRSRRAAVALAVAVGVLATAGRVGAGPAPAASRSYVVRPGDTLWGIAVRLVGPIKDPRPVIDRLIELNTVRDGVIVPGERLALP